MEDQRSHTCHIMTILLSTLLVVSLVSWKILTLASEDSKSTSSSALENWKFKSSEESLRGTKNVLLIMLDDAGWGDFSYHTSDPWYKLYTPSMDTIMEEGLYFSNYYTQTVCTPARASLMTGRWTWVLGIQKEILFKTCMDAHLSKSYPTYAELTHKKNYTNYIYGKWHLGMDSWTSTPLGRGFDEFTGSLNSGGITGGGGAVGEKGGWYSIIESKDWKCVKELADQKIRTRTYTECLMRSYDYYYADWSPTTHMCYSWLKINTPVVCPDFSKGSELDISGSVLYPYGQYVHLSLYDHSIDFWHNVKPGNPLIKVRTDMHLFDLASTQIIELSKTPEKRWTMMLSLKTPHQDSAYLENGTHSAVIPECNRYFEVDSIFYNYDRGAICQKMYEVDKRIGELMHELKVRGTWDDTLIILTNDNGGTSGQNPSLTGGAKEYNYAINWPFRGVKTSYYEGAVKTILAISGGALPPSLRATRNTDLHHVSDIAPTIAAAAGFTNNDFETISNGTNFDGYPLLSTVDADYGRHSHIYLSMPSLTKDWTSNASVLILEDGMKYFGPEVHYESFGYWGTLPLWSTLPSEWDDCTDGCVWNLTSDPFEKVNIGAHTNKSHFIGLINTAFHAERWNDGITAGMADCSQCSCCQSCAKDNTTTEYLGFKYYYPWLDNYTSIL